jgi:hypothetical protein
MSRPSVIAGHSASKTRVNALMTPAIHPFRKKMDARDKPGHDGVKGTAT